jgi:hypothetical protein
MAPELLRQGKFGKAADVYSFAIISASTLAVNIPGLQAAAASCIRVLLLHLLAASLGSQL